MRTATALLCATLVLASVAPALAHPTVELEPTAPTDLTFAATDNIEYLGRFPEHSGAAGGRLLGDRFYLTDPRGVYVYDVTDPAAPELLGSLALPQRSLGAALAQEDPDTNGEILLVDAVNPAAPTVGVDTDGGTLQVVDVSDPANIQVIGTADVADHTWNCVSAMVPAGLPEHAAGRAGERGQPEGRKQLNTCAFAYGRTGHIVDLRDPTDPQVLERTWRAAVDHGDRSNTPYSHDLTEIRPGLVMSAGSTNILMDTSDPADPVELARVVQPERFSSLGYHSVEWARGGDSPIVVFGTEIAPSGPTNLAGSDCNGENSVIETWDASPVIEALDAYDRGELTAAQTAQRARFERIDTFDAGDRGIYLEGQAPAHLLYCAHWMELHPDFDAGGKMVVSYYDRGTRFVEVAGDGTMTEIGWIVPAEGYSGSAQWISDEIVYVVDYRRGLEVIRLAPREATGTYRNLNDVVAAGSSVRAAGDGGDTVLGLGGASLLVGLLLLAVDVVRRRRAAPAAA